jgi:hypothetical protein
MFLPTDRCPNVLKPPNPQKIQSARCVVQHLRTCVNNIDVIDAEYSSVAETMRVRVIIFRKQHDVAIRSVRIDDVLRTANVIGRVVDSEQVVLVDPI